MLDLSSINNEKLRNLIAASLKFNRLSEDKQHAHLKSIKNLSAKKQKELERFFAQENAKENSSTVTILEQLFNELIDLEHKFTKLLRQETEIKDREKESGQMDRLLTQLNKN